MTGRAEGGGSSMIKLELGALDGCRPTHPPIPVQAHSTLSNTRATRRTQDAQAGRKFVLRTRAAPGIEPDRGFSDPKLRSLTPEHAAACECSSSLCSEDWGNHFVHGFRNCICKSIWFFQPHKHLWSSGYDVSRTR